MSTATPYQFVRNGQLFIIPVGPSIAEVPYPAQPHTKPKDYSQWVHGQIQDPALHLDSVRMPPSLYQEVRDDLVRYSPVEVTRSAFRRSQHAYVGVIDSRGTPYYFALDSRGISVREVDRGDDRVWKTFDHLAEAEHMTAVRKRRADATTEMAQVDRELSTPRLVIAKGESDSEAAAQSLKEEKQAIRDYARRGKHAHDQKLRRVFRHARGEEKEHASLFKPFTKAALSLVMLEDADRVGKTYASEMARAERELVARMDGESLAEDFEVEKAVKKTTITDKHFARVVQHAADSAPEEHGFGPRKVFIHHVHDAAKQHLGGMSLKEFKENLPKHRQAGTLSMARADLVGAMDPKKVAASETSDGSATHHFIVRSPSAAKSIAKALPRKAKEEKTKKTPSSKATKKQAGAGGKTRYTYPQEKKGGTKPGAKPGAKNAQPSPLMVEHDDAKHANPDELANQLGVSVRTLQRTAKRLGREGFAKFMRSHLKRFAAKHRLDPDYWGTLYERLRAADVKAAY